MLIERIGTLARTVERALHGDADAPVAWTGRQMRVRWFGEHMREELVIHRWDLAGDDRISCELLGAPWFTQHSVVAVGRPQHADAQPPTSRRCMSTIARPKPTPTTVSNVQSPVQKTPVRNGVP